MSIRPAAQIIQDSDLDAGILYYHDYCSDLPQIAVAKDMKRARYVPLPLGAAILGCFGTFADGFSPAAIGAAAAWTAGNPQLQTGRSMESALALRKARFRQDGKRSRGRHATMSFLRGRLPWRNSFWAHPAVGAGGAATPTDVPAAHEGYFGRAFGPLRGHSGHEPETHNGGNGPPRRGGVGGWGSGGGDGDGERGWDGEQGEGRERLVALGAAQRRRGGGGYGGAMFTATQTLTALNVIVFLLQARYPFITRAGWKMAPAITQQGQWYRLITPVVLHGSLTHLLVNTMSFNSVGPVVERVLGTKKFLATYALAGVAGNVLSCIVNPRMPAVGASGAIFGMVGAWAAFCVMNEAILGRANSQRALKNVGQTVMINVIYGMSSSQIDNMGHLGGFLGGAATTFLIGPRFRRRYHPLTGEPYTEDVSMQFSLPRLEKRQ